MVENDSVMDSSVDSQNQLFSSICAREENKTFTTSPEVESSDVFSLTFLHFEDEDNAFSNTLEV